MIRLKYFRANTPSALTHRRVDEETDTSSDPRGKLLPGGVISAFVVFYCVYGLRYSTGSFARVGPGMFPRIAGVVMAGGLVLWCGLLFVEAHSKGRKEEQKVVQKRHQYQSILRAVVFFVAIFAFPSIVVRVGFIPTVSGLLVLVMGFTGKQKLWFVGVFSVGLAFVASMIFGGFLHVPLPPDFS